MNRWRDLLRAKKKLQLRDPEGLLERSIAESARIDLRIEKTLGLISKQANKNAGFRRADQGSADRLYRLGGEFQDLDAEIVAQRLKMRQAGAYLGARIELDNSGHLVLYREEGIILSKGVKALFGATAVAAIIALVSYCLIVSQCYLVRIKMIPPELIWFK